MAYKIKEVQDLTGVSAHTLRYWAKEGLFPFVEKNHCGVKYFSNSDLEWVKLISCLRSVDMSIEEIKEYINLCSRGMTTALQRKEMLVNKRVQLLQKIKQLQESLEHLDYKVAYYDEMLSQNQDGLNPLNYKKIPKTCKDS